MKKLIVIFAVAIATVVLVLSCEHNENMKELIVGKWKCEKIVFEDDGYEYVPEDDGDYLQFNADGTYIETNTFVGTTSEDRGTWTLEGKKLTMSSPVTFDDFLIFEVKELTKTSMVLFDTYEKSNAYYSKIN